MDQADVVVIGGGVTGASIAYHLAKAGAGYRRDFGLGDDHGRGLGHSPVFQRRESPVSNRAWVSAHLKFRIIFNP